MSNAVVKLLSPGDAQRLTQRIKLTAGTVRDGLFKLRNLVDEARDSNAWQVLGFASWTAYLSDTLASEPMRLERSERQTLVEYLSGEGLSTRAIAPIVGASVAQVKRDVRGSNEPPAQPVASQVAAAEDVHTVDAPVAVDPSTGEIIDAPVTTEHTVTEKTKTVVGLDGKSYTKPEAKPRALKPVPTGDEAARLNAEQGARDFGFAISTLWGLTLDGHRKTINTDWWPNGMEAARLADRETVTAENFRAIAVALNQLADEWEN